MLVAVFLCLVGLCWLNSQVAFLLYDREDGNWQLRINMAFTVSDSREPISQCTFLNP